MLSGGDQWQGRAPRNPSPKFVRRGELSHAEKIGQTSREIRGGVKSLANFGLLAKIKREETIHFGHIVQQIAVFEKRAAAADVINKRIGCGGAPQQCQHWRADQGTRLAELRDR